MDKLSESLYFGTTSENQYLKLECGMRLNFEIDDIHLSDEFIVVPRLSKEVIIGVTTMQNGASNWILNMIQL